MYQSWRLTPIVSANVDICIHIYKFFRPAMKLSNPRHGPQRHGPHAKGYVFNGIHRGFASCDRSKAAPYHPVNAYRHLGNIETPCSACRPPVAPMHDL